jgi:CelD/BcsL family acetyltransferase involved in cellulose biosynthesis
MVALTAAPPWAELEQEWLRLQARADTSFFITWSWIGCWLQGLGPSAQPQLLRATRGGQVVGLAVLLCRRGRRLKLLPMRCLHLHATGDPAQDDITIEHNGFLVHRSACEQIEAAMYGHLLKQAHWDQLLLPGLSTSQLLAALLPRTMALREYSHQSYIVDLYEVRRRGGDYLGMLSSNTRQQIRRSFKAYESLGPLTLSVAPDLDTALGYLAALRGLHEKRWNAKGEPGVFAHPGFEAFHRRLISSAFAHGEIQLLRVHAGTHDLGYLYSFVHRGRVLFYQSGFDYELLQNHSRPGFVTHVMGVQHNAGLGHNTYDFLSGTARYKLSLASGAESMVWTTVHRKTAGFWLEEVLRYANRRRQQARANRQARAAPAEPATASPIGMDVHPLHLASTTTPPVRSRL